MQGCLNTPSKMRVRHTPAASSSTPSPTLETPTCRSDQRHACLHLGACLVPSCAPEDEDCAGRPVLRGLPAGGGSGADPVGSGWPASQVQGCVSASGGAVRVVHAARDMPGAWACGPARIWPDVGVPLSGGTPRSWVTPGPAGPCTRNPVPSRTESAIPPARTGTTTLWRR